MIYNLKKLRKLQGISQQKLAENIMVSQQSVNKYENHNIEPDINTLIKIADYFNVSVDYLIGRTEIPYRAELWKDTDLSVKEASLIQKFRVLKLKQQECIINLIDSYL